MTQATTTDLLTADSIEVRLFLLAWHENGRAGFERRAPYLDYDAHELKHAIERKRWICLDHGKSGAFVADRQTHEVYTIKAYGRPNRKIGTLESLTAEYVGL